VLLHRAKAGDRSALDELMRRYLPRLRRWASGRLPRWGRDLADTHDLVQETVFRAFRRIEVFEPRSDGALQAYLRQILANRIKEELRRVSRRPGKETLDESRPSEAESPLERAIGRQAMERYDLALTRLKSHDREAIVARLELGCSFEEVAVALGKPTANAARSAVHRAMQQLIEEMRRVGR